MKIKEITSEYILFDNGKQITFENDQNCAYNFADFLALKGTIGEEFNWYEFKEPLNFEYVENYGFRFGNGSNMFFVPCYSIQNGWYSDSVKIFFNGEEVLNYVSGNLII